MKKILAGSLLAADIGQLTKEVAHLEASGIDMIHIDVMDGVFVPNMAFCPAAVKAIKQSTKLPLDVHLMVQNPSWHIEVFSKAGADFLTIHLEATTHLDRVLRQIKQCGVKAGIALLPATPHTALDYVLEIVDLVLIMTVNPGFGGQQFLISQLAKIEAVAKKLPKNVVLSVDGGINAGIIALAANAGANCFVSGNYLYQDELEKSIAALRKLI
jgi:ribulose-phosphate 3-epimerase